MSDSKEVILGRLLDNIDDKYDKSEGSFFYDTQMPLAIELEKSYSEQNLILENSFVDTATGIYLDKKIAEIGLTRKPASYSTTTVTITGTIGSEIKIGDKVSSDEITFLVTENKIIGISGSELVNVQCEVAGTLGNMPQGAIKYFPITISGLVSVTNLSSISNGYDGESDEELRDRYYDKIRTPSTSGNKYHYMVWAKEIVGVGDAKVTPLWNGNGTVKVMIINSNKRAASQLLIDEVSDHIEENRPIGATVTVVTASELPINISVTLVIDELNYTVAGIKTLIENSLTSYFASISFKENYASYAKIGSIIFDTPGVLDYSSLQINSGIINVIIADGEIPILGGVTVG